MDFMFYVIYKTFLKKRDARSDPDGYYGNAFGLMGAVWGLNTLFLVILASHISDIPIQDFMHSIYLLFMAVACILISYFKFAFRKKYLKIYDRYSGRKLELWHYLLAWGYVACSLLLLIALTWIKFLLYTN